MKNKIANLINVKSIITILLTIVFAWLSITDKITADQFMTVFTVVISFYFGTQFEKNNSDRKE